ncbi:MAG: SUMF1/EgtB/PvdO family nonheme iron enzyme [Anaerolineaceae bacterium]|nr:SUMF1/EgtB/PvdO family nonheme iron enzyme [Anaerolineaceae bacterium]
MRRFAAISLGVLIALFLAIDSVTAQPPGPAAASPTPAPSATALPSPTSTSNPIDACFENGLIACVPGVARELGAWGVVVLLAAFLLIFFVVTPLGKIMQDGIQEWLKSRFNFRSVPMPASTTRDYLNQAVIAYSRFKFRGLPTHVGENSANRLSLDLVYVSLRVLAQGHEIDEGIQKQERAALGHMAKSESASLPQVLREPGNRRLAIIGIAGSGKSTLLQWSGLACARALLGEKLNAEQKELIGIFGGKAPFPIFVPLRAYNEYCRKNEVTRSLKSMLDFLPVYFNEDQANCQFTSEFFKTQLQKRCLVMFDGVDEVEMEDRPGVQHAVETLLSEFDHPHLYCFIASRNSAAYISDQMEGFQRCEVQRLSKEQRRDLILFWHSAVYAEDPVKGKKQANNLIQRLETAPAQVRELATTPLMATIFCMVSYSHELPRLRAKLYEDAIQVLLTDTLHHEGDFYKGLAEWGGQDWEDRRDHLSFIAFTLQERKISKLPEVDLVDLIWQEFEAETREISEKSARKFLYDIAGRGGLLEEQDKEYGFFTHATFQEYLAGRYLAQEMDDQEQAAFLEDHFANDQWWEAIRLAAGYLSLGGRNDADRFVNALAGAGNTSEAKASALALAGECLIDMRKRDEQTVNRVSGRIEAAMTADPPYVSAALRLRLGLDLGMLGDPRIQPLKPVLCPVPAGFFRMGTSRADGKMLEDQGAQFWNNEQPDHEVYVSTFEIGRYPVTNKEFAAFFEAGGYDDPNHWSTDGWNWRSGRRDSDLSFIADENIRSQYNMWLDDRPAALRAKPFFWDDPQWNVSNLPVVGVTWFEAEAYCKWLSSVTGENYHLPTETEWEKAARGSDGRLWAWGNAWNAGFCNCSDGDTEDQLGRTSPVGMYPQGHSPYGVEDMVGNVWEWCADWYAPDLYRTRTGQEVKDPRGPEQGNARVVRGGAWDDNRNFARCACRVLVPGLFLNHLGFRLVRSPSTSAL